MVTSVVAQGGEPEDGGARAHRGGRPDPSQADAGDDVKKKQIAKSIALGVRLEFSRSAIGMVLSACYQATDIMPRGRAESEWVWRCGSAANGGRVTSLAERGMIK
jgi:hypothetical protein